MGLRVGTRVGNTYVSTNGHNVRTTTKVCKNVYVTNTFGKKQTKSKSAKCSSGAGCGLSFLGSLIFICILVWSPFNYILNIDLESGTLPSFDLFPIIASFAFMMLTIVLDIVLILLQTSKAKNNKKLNKNDLNKIEREYQAIIKMYPTFEGSNHESVLSTVKQYRQFEYSKVLKQHQEERERMYSALCEYNMQELNNPKKAIKKTLKCLDENFDWIND